MGFIYISFYRIQINVILKQKLNMVDTLKIKETHTLLIFLVYIILVCSTCFVVAHLIVKINPVANVR